MLDDRPVIRTGFGIAKRGWGGMFPMVQEWRRGETEDRAHTEERCSYPI